MCISERVGKMRGGRPLNPNPMYDRLCKKYPEQVNEYKKTIKKQK